MLRWWLLAALCGVAAAVGGWYVDVRVRGEVRAGLASGLVAGVFVAVLVLSWGYDW